MSKTTITQYHCDVCGSEMPRPNDGIDIVIASDRDCATILHARFGLSISYSNGETHICMECCKKHLLKALKALDNG